MEKHNIVPSELLKKISEVADKVLKGNYRPWALFPTISLTNDIDYEEFIKYRKIKHEDQRSI